MAKSLTEVAEKMTDLVEELKELGSSVGFSPDGLSTLENDVWLFLGHAERVESDFEGDSVQGFEE